MGMKLTAILSLEKKTEMVFCLLNHENKKHIFNVSICDHSYHYPVMKERLNCKHFYIY